MPHRYAPRPIWVTTHTWSTENFCNCAITGTVIFNSKCTGKCLSDGLHSDQLGEFTMLSKLCSWNCGGDSETGKGHKGKGGKGWKNGGKIRLPGYRERRFYKIKKMALLFYACYLSCYLMLSIHVIFTYYYMPPKPCLWTQVPIFSLSYDKRAEKLSLLKKSHTYV